MPSEVTAPAAIVAFVLMIVVVVGYMFLVNAAVILQESISKSLTYAYSSEKQSLYITSASRVNSTYILLNLTVKGLPVIPLTHLEVIVKYIDNTTGKPLTTMLAYNSTPGWGIKTIYDGDLRRDLSAGDYLIPGEVAELSLYLPTPSSPSYPVIVVAVSPRGTSTMYSVGGG
ncbi:MAG: hypothetical protein J7L55_02710 [Desulfurococcales archaeon]|nr:hypothetical protein [Desulfurococcales archaeon]